MGEQQLYIRVRGKVTGPFGMAQLKSLRNRGQLGGFHEISEDRRTWVAASTLEQLFPPESQGPDAPHSRAVAGPSGAGEPPQQSTDWYYIDSEGRQKGPVSQRRLRSLQRARRLTAATMVWRQGLREWLPVSETELSRAKGDRSRRPSRVINLLQWQRVRVGVTLGLVNAFLLIGGVALGLFGFLIVLLGQEVFDIAVAMGMLFTARLTYLAAQIVEVVGFGFYINAPEKYGARGLAVTSLVIGICSILFGAVAALVVIPIHGFGSGFGAFLIGPVMAGLLAAAKTIVFLFLVRALALYLQNERVARASVTLLIIYGVVLFISLAIGLFVLMAPSMFVGVRDAAKGLTAFVVVLGFFIFLDLAAFLTWFVWYIVTLFQLRGAVSRYVSPAGPDSDYDGYSDS
jgi:hypothetical protein